MAKRKTQAQREQEQRDALQQRIADIYAGACGRVVSEDEDWPGIEDVGRIIPAVREVFGEPFKDWFGYQPHNLGRWQTVVSATDFLFEYGFRADKEWPEQDDA